MAVAVLHEVQIIVLFSDNTATVVSGKSDADFDPTLCSLFVGYYAEG